jgi:manganese transport protein
MGAALGLNLVFGIALFPAALIAGAGAFGILALQQRGFRRLEAVIAGMVGVVVAAFAFEVFETSPSGSETARHLFVPGFSGTESILLATGILGATVMPHVVYLHSGLVQHRAEILAGESKREHFRREMIDIALAMNGAFLINASMVIMAAAVFFHVGADISGIEDAHATLGPLLGSLAPAAFGIALLASGLSSSTVGTMAGQMIVDGFMNWRVSVFIRRLITMIPALIVIGAGADTLRTLVASQVVLSLVLPFAVVPLVWLTSRRDVMGGLVNGPVVRVLAIGVSVLVIAMNVVLLVVTATGG